MAEGIDDEWPAVSEAVAGRRDAREKAVRGKEPLWLEVSAILFHHDPIGINFETNSDEYDAEAQTIVLRLPEAASAQHLEVICLDVFTRWFSSDMAGPRTRYVRIAAEIWEAAQRGVGRSR